MGNSKDSSDDRGEKERTWRDAYHDELVEVVSGKMIYFLLFF